MATIHSLTRKTIEALPRHPASSSSTEAEYSDAGCPGLKLCVTKNGRKYFRLRYTFMGRKRALTLGNFGPMSIESARMKAHEIKHQLAQGIDPQQPTPTQPAVPTFQMFTENVYMPHTKSTKRSWRDDFFKFKNHMWPYFGKMAIDQIATSHVINYLQGLKKKGLADATYNRHLALLSAVFKYAIAMGCLKTNSCKGVPTLKENNRVVRFLQPHEWQRLMGMINNGKIHNRTIVDFMLICLSTGVRRSEALLADWRDIDLANRTWRLPHTKSGVARAVPLNDRAIAIFNQMTRHNSTDAVFVNARTGKRFVNPTKGFQRILRQAGISNFRIHDCRHTFASMIASNKGNMYALKELLGHQSITTTQRYAHLSNEQLRQESALACQIPGITGLWPVASQDHAETI